MKHDHLRIEIGGAEVGERFYRDLILLEVELDDELAGMFRMTVALLRADGRWPYLDEEPFTPWSRVVITAGFENDSEQLIVGYITHLLPEFGAALEQSRLQIWGMDASVVMDREDKLKAWPNKKDSDIATETFREHGLAPQVTDTEVIHDEEVSTIIQRETDIQFLKRLALRNGFECFVDGDTGYFRPLAVSDTPQPVLAVHFGHETNVNRLALQVNVVTPANVAMFQVDRIDGKILDAAADSARQPALGSKPHADYLQPGIPSGLVYLGQTVTTGALEMTGLCQSLHDQGEWFVTGDGEVAANEYGSILKPRRTVTIKGVGETHSGVYYVTQVTHAFASSGYTQAFRIKRNALAPTGAEQFSMGGNGLAGALAGLVTIAEGGQ
jgi:phage protein D